MSKPKDAPEEEPQESKLPPTLKERVEAAVYVAYGQHNLATEEGEPDQEALIDETHAIVVKAVVERPSERGKMRVTRSQFMEQIFPQVPSRDEWIEQKDPELAQGVYTTLDGHIWRLLNVDPDGPVQAKLNGENSLVLCRVDGNRNHEGHAYVTRNRKCLWEDYSAKSRAAIERANNRHAALMEQAISRVPEHGESFMREHDTTTRTAMENSKNAVRGALEASKDVKPSGKDITDGGSE